MPGTKELMVKEPDLTPLCLQPLPTVQRGQPHIPFRAHALLLFTDSGQIITFVPLLMFLALFQDRGVPTGSGRALVLPAQV